jgi:hypothetical protein
LKTNEFRIDSLARFSSSSVGGESRIPRISCFNARTASAIVEDLVERPTWNTPGRR